MHGDDFTPHNRAIERITSRTAKLFSHRVEFQDKKQTLIHHLSKERPDLEQLEGHKWDGRQTEMEKLLFIPETRERTCRTKEEKQGPVPHAHGGGSFMTVMPSVLEGSAYS